MNGLLIRNLLTGLGKQTEAWCEVCRQSIDIALMGVSALGYHAKSGKHQKNLKDSERMDTL